MFLNVFTCSSGDVGPFHEIGFRRISLDERDGIWVAENTVKR